MCEWIHTEIRKILNCITGLWGCRLPVSMSTSGSFWNGHRMCFCVLRDTRCELVQVLHLVVSRLVSSYDVLFDLLIFHFTHLKVYFCVYLIHRRLVCQCAVASCGLMLMTNEGYFQGGARKAPSLSQDLLEVDGHWGWVGESVSSSGVVRGRLSVPLWMTPTPCISEH